MRFLVVLAVIALTVYSVIDCAGADERQRRGLPAWLWVTVIIVIPGVGALTWLLVSRSAPEPRPRGYERPKGPLAPDDDPDFLAGLSRRTPPVPEPAPEPDTAEPSEEPKGADESRRDEDRGRQSPE